MEKLFSWTAIDGKNQTLKAPAARSSDNLLDEDHDRCLQAPRLQTRCADFQSALRALAPAAYADVLVPRPLPGRRHRIPIIFLGPLPQEEEEPVQIQVGSIKVSAETFHQ